LALKYSSRKRPEKAGQASAGAVFVTGGAGGGAGALQAPRRHRAREANPAVRGRDDMGGTRP
jgi:hypothetical protein